MEQPLDSQKKPPVVQANPVSDGSGGLSVNALEATSPDAQASVDRLIDYVSEQIELLAFDEVDTAQLERLIVQLIESFVDPRRTQRVQLVDALGQIGEPATPFLLRALGNHAEVVVRRACCHALSHIGDETAVCGLIAALLDDPDISVKSAAAGALAKMGAPAFDGLRDILASETASENSKGHAAWAMASMSHEVMTKLYDSVQDPSPAVRTAVIGAIAQVAQKQVAQKQVAQGQMAQDPMPWGQAQVTVEPVEPDRSAFRRLDLDVPDTHSSPQNVGFQPLSLLIQALADASSDVRIEAVAHLARLNCQQAREPLIRCLQDPQWEVRKAVILALGKLGSVAVVTTSVASTDTHNSVSSNATLVAAIAKLTQDPVEAVQQAATLVVNQLEAGLV